MRERFRSATAEAGRPVTTLVSVLDLEGMTMRQAGAATRTYIGRASALDSAHYPETLGKMLVINAPGIFAAVWAVAGRADGGRRVQRCDGTHAAVGTSSGHARRAGANPASCGARGDVPLRLLLTVVRVQLVLEAAQDVKSGPRRELRHALQRGKTRRSRRS
jgi:hypothetical protein